MLDSLIRHLQGSKSLDLEQVQSAVVGLTDPEVSVETKAGFLTALSTKGETISEIEAFAVELLKRSVPIPIDPAARDRGIVDVCGTGGDHLNTFNISTSVALVVSAAGLTVAKHGNRAITSKAGSADLLEALGIRLDLSPEAAAGVLARVTSSWMLYSLPGQWRSW